MPKEKTPITPAENDLLNRINQLGQHYEKIAQEQSDLFRAFQNYHNNDYDESTFAQTFDNFSDVLIAYNLSKASFEAYLKDRATKSK